MKIRSFIRTLFFILILFANYVHAEFVRLPLGILKTGDILLISLKCHLCQMIESEENSEFSHIALIVKDQTNTFFAEAWNDGVKTKTYDEFFSNKRLRQGSRIVVLRKKMKSIAKVSYLRLLKSFEGQSYDSSFLWDNIDDVGKEKLYCSEFVYKFYSKWLNRPFALTPKRMNFTKNWSEWIKFFHGKVPQGKLGISPEDFYRSSDFYILLESKV